MINVVTDVFRSFEVEDSDNNVIRVDEGNTIKFSLETGEVVSGIVTKISGKGDKTKIQIAPAESQKEEIYSVVVIADGTFEVIA